MRGPRQLIRENAFIFEKQETTQTLVAPPQEVVDEEKTITHSHAVASPSNGPHDEYVEDDRTGGE
jgi:hypothetical protein